MNTPHRPLFELLLLAFPASFRHRFGESMRDAFDAARAEHRHSRTRLLGFLLRTSTDMVWSGVQERCRPTLRLRRPAGALARRGGMRFSSLDLKLGVRMLFKHPVLSAVTVFALAIGIPVGLAPTHLANALEAPLPVPDGDRIRLLRHWNPLTSTPDVTTLDDFERWRGALTTFESLGAARRSTYNVDSNDELAPPVRGAEVTASTFDILRVPPLVGRPLGLSDEAVGAAAVVVIGYDLWQSRLGGDPAIVGRDLRIGGVPHAIVGVMPQGFLFPTRHQLWLPLRDDRVAASGDSPALLVFGRLSDGVTEEAAQAELAAVGRRPDPAAAGVDPWIQPEVVPYSYVVFAGPTGGAKATPEYYVSQFVTLVLLLVACTNVGMLIFARTVARSGELAVRTALGASRARIVGQVFAESLVLAMLAAGLGLWLIDWLPAWLIALADPGTLPYWIDLGVSRATVAWTVVLAAGSAVVAGVLPALRVTGRSVHGAVQRAQASRAGSRLGGLTSALIVADVAIAVATVGLAVGVSQRLTVSWDGRAATGIEAAEFLSAEVRFSRTDPRAGDPGVSEGLPTGGRAARLQQALVARLEAEPGVRGVAVASALPRMDHPTRFVEVDGAETVEAAGPSRVRTASVDPAFFEALGHPIRSGRGFDTSDLGEGRRAVIVNSTFVEQVLGGRNPLGRRVRYTTRSGDGEPGAWHEIVGVVGSLGMRVLNPELDAGLYHPLPPGSDVVQLALHVGHDPESFTPRLRAIANEIDPAISVGAPVALDRVVESDWYLMAGVTLGGGVLVGLLLALAASGLYAIMSFAVAERTREIGIRAALGARRSAIAFVVARRAVAQLGVGALLGTPVAGVIFFELAQDAGTEASTLVALAAALAPGVVVMILVGLVACTAPTLRALRITPTEALKG